MRGTSTPALVVRGLAAASTASGVSVRSLMRPNGNRNTAHARWIAWELLRDHGNMSSPQIAQFTKYDGSWNHTSVLNGLRRINQVSATDPAFADMRSRAHAIFEADPPPCVEGEKVRDILRVEKAILDLTARLEKVEAQENRIKEAMRLTEEANRRVSAVERQNEALRARIQELSDRLNH